MPNIPPRNLEDIHSDQHALAQERAEFEELIKRKRAELDREQERLVEERKPLLELQQKHRLLRAKIDRVKALRPGLENQRDEWLKKIDMLFSSDTAPLNVTQTINAWPDDANAERSLAELDRWIPVQEQELLGIEREMQALAEPKGWSLGRILGKTESGSA